MNGKQVVQSISGTTSPMGVLGAACFLAVIGLLVVLSLIRAISYVF